MGRALDGHGMTAVGTLADDLGEIRLAFRDACRMIAVDAWDTGLPLCQAYGRRIRSSRRQP